MTIFSDFQVAEKHVSTAGVPRGSNLFPKTAGVPKGLLFSGQLVCPEGQKFSGHLLT